MPAMSIYRDDRTIADIISAFINMQLIDRIDLIQASLLNGKEWGKVKNNDRQKGATEGNEINF
jgi:hypothetical protein